MFTAMIYLIWDVHILYVCFYACVDAGYAQTITLSGVSLDPLL